MIRLTRSALSGGASGRLQVWLKTLERRGVSAGVAIDADAKGAWFETPRQLVDRCRDFGAILHATKSGVMRIAPPLTITQDELDRGLDMIERSFQSP